MDVPVEPSKYLQMLLESEPKGQNVTHCLVEFISANIDVPQDCTKTTMEQLASKMKAVIKNPRASTNDMEQAQVILQVLQQLSAYDHHEQGLNILLDHGLLDMMADVLVTCLHCVRETRGGIGDRVYEDALETLVGIADYSTKAKVATVEKYCDRLLQIIVSGSFRFETKMEALKSLNLLLEKCPLAVRERLLELTYHQELLHKLGVLVSNIGDYEFQVGIIEALFRLVGRGSRQNLAKSWFNQESDLNNFLQIRDSDFETDCRLFLNVLNATMSSKLRVHSFPCISTILGKFELLKPVDDNYTEFWVDFNTGSKRITIFCNQEPTESQMDSEEEGLWETVSIWDESVVSYTIEDSGSQQIVKITLKGMARELISFGPQFNDNTVTIVFHRDPADVKLALESTFGKIKSVMEKPPGPKVSAAEYPIHVSTTNKSQSPQVHIPETIDEETSQEDPVHVKGTVSMKPNMKEQSQSQESEVSTPKPKISVPCEPMRTPSFYSASRQPLVNHGKLNTLSESSKFTIENRKTEPSPRNKDSGTPKAQTPKMSHPTKRVKTPLQMVQSHDLASSNTNIQQQVPTRSRKATQEENQVKGTVSSKTRGGRSRRTQSDSSGTTEVMQTTVPDKTEPEDTTRNSKLPVINKSRSCGTRRTQSDSKDGTTGAMQTTIPSETEPEITTRSGRLPKMSQGVQDEEKDQVIPSSCPDEQVVVVPDSQPFASTVFRNQFPALVTPEKMLKKSISHKSVADDSGVMLNETTEYEDAGTAHKMAALKETLTEHDPNFSYLKSRYKVSNTPSLSTVSEESTPIGNGLLQRLDSETKRTSPKAGRLKVILEQDERNLNGSMTSVEEKKEDLEPDNSKKKGTVAVQMSPDSTSGSCEQHAGQNKGRGRGRKQVQSSQEAGRKGRGKKPCQTTKEKEESVSDKTGRRPQRGRKAKDRGQDTETEVERPTQEGRRVTRSSKRGTAQEEDLTQPQKSEEGKDKVETEDIVPSRTKEKLTKSKAKMDKPATDEREKEIHSAPSEMKEKVGMSKTDIDQLAVEEDEEENQKSLSESLVEKFIANKMKKKSEMMKDTSKVADSAEKSKGKTVKERHSTDHTVSVDETLKKDTGRQVSPKTTNKVTVVDLVDDELHSSAKSDFFGNKTDKIAAEVTVVEDSQDRTDSKACEHDYLGKSAKVRERNSSQRKARSHVFDKLEHPSLSGLTQKDPINIDEDPYDFNSQDDLRKDKTRTKSKSKSQVKSSDFDNMKNAFGFDDSDDGSLVNDRENDGKTAATKDRSADGKSKLSSNSSQSEPKFFKSRHKEKLLQESQEIELYTFDGPDDEDTRKSKKGPSKTKNKEKTQGKRQTLKQSGKQDKTHVESSENLNQDSQTDHEKHSRYARHDKKDTLKKAQGKLGSTTDADRWTSPVGQRKEVKHSTRGKKPVHLSPKQKAVDKRKIHKAVQQSDEEEIIIEDSDEPKQDYKESILDHNEDISCNHGDDDRVQVSDFAKMCKGILEQSSTRSQIRGTRSRKVVSYKELSESDFDDISVQEVDISGGVLPHPINSSRQSGSARPKRKHRSIFSETDDNVSVRSDVSWLGSTARKKKPRPEKAYTHRQTQGRPRLITKQHPEDDGVKSESSDSDVGTSHITHISKKHQDAKRRQQQKENLDITLPESSDYESLYYEPKRKDADKRIGQENKHTKGNRQKGQVEAKTARGRQGKALQTLSHVNVQTPVTPVTKVTADNQGLDSVEIPRFDDSLMPTPYSVVDSPMIPTFSSIGHEKMLDNEDEDRFTASQGSNVSHISSLKTPKTPHIQEDKRSTSTKSTKSNKRSFADIDELEDILKSGPSKRPKITRTTHDLQEEEPQEEEEEEELDVIEQDLQDMLDRVYGRTNLDISTLRPRRLFSHDAQDAEEQTNESGGERSMEDKEKETGSSTGTEEGDHDQEEREQGQQEEEVEQEVEEEEEHGFFSSSGDMDLDMDVGLQTGVTTLIKSFGSEIQKNMLARRQNLEQLTRGTLKTTQKQVSSIWQNQQVARHHLMEEFRGILSKELDDLELDVDKIKSAEDKLVEFFMQQMTVIKDSRSSQIHRLHRLKKAETSFVSSLQNLEENEKGEQASLREVLRKEMYGLQKKILKQTQQQEVTNVRRTLQTLFL